MEERAPDPGPSLSRVAWGNKIERMNAFLLKDIVKRREGREV